MEDFLIAFGTGYAYMLGVAAALVLVAAALALVGALLG